MRAQFQFAHGRTTLSHPAHLVFVGLSFLTLLLCPAVMGADDTPSNVVGRIEGRDVSVEAGSGGGAAWSAPTTVSSGDVVTVHSAKARLMLSSGGKIEICGPAKLTLLLSGKALTLALSFGRVRAELPATTTLRIFTPTIVGTPIDISGGVRDVTVGLNLDDSLCVLAASGAIQLEHQFTGEKIIVPQAAEFFLNPGQLVPALTTPGKCQCLADEPSPSRPSVVPEFATLAPSPTVSNTSSAALPAERLKSAPGLSYSVLEHANQGHPLAASEKMEVPAMPPSSLTSEAVVAPALVFTATSPLPPPGPSEETVLLIREAQLSPEWEFSGRVEPPEFASAMEHALGEKPVSASPAPPPAEPLPAPQKKKKGGFWAALKHVFGGGG
jgi:hypothetical protein